MDPVTGSLIGGGMKVLGGLFGRKKKSMSPAQSIMSTAQGAREAGAKHGFNPLTLLQASNATAGAGMDMGTPPLASLSILGDLVEDSFGEDALTRKAHNRLQNELLTLEVERARGAMSVIQPQMAARGGALTGGRTTQVTASPVAGAAFLDEDDRGEAHVDERDNTVSFQSHGQETVVPIGPDLEEVFTGLMIQEHNKGKARKAWEADADARGFTRGTPLKVPRTTLPGGLGGAITFDDPAKLLPPKPKKRPKPQRTNPFVPLHMQSIY